MSRKRMTRRVRRTVVAIVSIGAGTLAVPSVSVSAVDADGYGLVGEMSPGAVLFPLTPATTTYLVGGACLTDGPVSTYVDVSRGESGGCGVGGSNAGNIELKGCSTGSINAASWQLTEPSNDLATFTGSGVVVGGVTLITGSPVHGSPGDGYFDPSTTSSPGTGVFVGVVVPQVGQFCVRGVTSFDFAGALVGEY